MTYFHEICQLVLIALIFATGPWIGSTDSRDLGIKLKRFSKVITEMFHYLWPRGYLELKRRIFRECLL